MDNTLDRHDFVVLDEDMIMSREVPEYDVNDEPLFFSNVSQTDLEKQLHEILEENEKLKRLEDTTAIGETMTALQMRVASTVHAMPQNRDTLRSAGGSIDGTDRVEDCLERSSLHVTLDDLPKSVDTISSARTRDSSLIIDKANRSLEKYKPMKKSAILTQSFIKEIGDSKMAAKTTLSDSTETSSARTRDSSLIVDKANRCLKKIETIKKSAILSESFLKETGDLMMAAKATFSDSTKNSSARTRDSFLIIDKANKSLEKYEMIKKSVILQTQILIKEIGDSKMAAKAILSNSTKSEIKGKGAGSKSLECTSGPKQFAEDKPFEVFRTWMTGNFERLGILAKWNLMENKPKASDENEREPEKIETDTTSTSLSANECAENLKLELPVNRVKPQEKLLEKSSQELQSLKGACQQLTESLADMQTACEAWRRIVDQESFKELVDRQEKLQDSKKCALEIEVSLLAEHCRTLTKKVKAVSAENEALRIEKENWKREKKSLEVTASEHQLLLKEVNSLCDMCVETRLNSDNSNTHRSENFIRNFSELFRIVSNSPQPSQTLPNV